MTAPAEKGIAFVNVLIISITLVVVAIPEGLPLIATLALAFFTKRMTKENILVRILGSFLQELGQASIICAEKIGTLTHNEMSAVAGSVDVNRKFVRLLRKIFTRTNAEETEQSEPASQTVRKHANDFSLDQCYVSDTLPPAVRHLFNEAIAVSSTAFQKTPEAGEAIFVRSKTEVALLKFAQDLDWANFDATSSSRCPGHRDDPGLHGAQGHGCRR